MLPIVLALGASLAWGVSDFLGGLKSRTLPLFIVLLISQGAALVVLALVVISVGEPPPGGEFLLFGFLAGISEAIGVAALYRGLAIGVISIVAPVAATAPIVPLLVGLALGEVPGTLQGAGIALAVVGIVIAATRSEASGRPGQALGPSLFFGAVCALGFGSFYVAMDAASEGGEIQWALLLARATSVAVFIVVVVLTRPAPAPRREEIPVIAGIGLLIIAADAMYATASTKGILGIVAALSTLYPIVTIALARVYLREQVAPRQQLGIAVSLSGVVAISAGV
jgi:drug/metabolite transporter (DMT)-like permease